MSSKTSSKIISSLLLVLILALFSLVYHFRDYRNTLVFDGLKYDFNIYDLSGEKITFSRSEKDPEIFKKHKWLPAATIQLGGLFVKDWDVTKLQSFFENPSETPSKYVPDPLGRLDLNSTITVIGLVKFHVSEAEYLYVSLKTSDLPNGVQYSLLKKFNGRWVSPSNKLSVISDFPLRANQLNEKIKSEAENKKLQYSEIENLK